MSIKELIEQLVTADQDALVLIMAPHCCGQTRNAPWDEVTEIRVDPEANDLFGGNTVELS